MHIHHAWVTCLHTVLFVVHALSDNQDKTIAKKDGLVFLKLLHLIIKIQQTYEGPLRVEELRL